MPKRAGVAPKEAPAADLTAAVAALRTEFDHYLTQTAAALDRGADFYNSLLARVEKLEAATGVNPPATGDTVERTVLARLDAVERHVSALAEHAAANSQE